MKKLLLVYIVLILGAGTLFSRPLSDDGIEMSHDDHILLMKSLPPQVNNYLKKHLSKYVIPLKQSVEPGVYTYILDQDTLNHPSFCQGDFNEDGLTDYAMILTYYDNEAILVILNQTQEKWYELYVVGLVLNYTEEFITYDGSTLLRGNLNGVSEFISWDESEQRYKRAKVSPESDEASLQE